MPLQYVHGDLLWGKDDVIVHGCNCFHKMGKGIAKQIRFAYPGAYLQDLKTKLGDADKLGTFSYWSGQHRFRDQTVMVVNAYVQYDYGYDRKFLIDDALLRALTQVSVQIPIEQSIGLPKIGIGLAGADWKDIEPIFEEAFRNRLVTVYEMKS